MPKHKTQFQSEKKPTLSLKNTGIKIGIIVASLLIIIGFTWLLYTLNLNLFYLFIFILILVIIRLFLKRIKKTPNLADDIIDNET